MRVSELTLVGRVAKRCSLIGFVVSWMAAVGLLVAPTAGRASERDGTAPERFVNSVGMELQYLPGGEYRMGTDQEYWTPTGNVATFGPAHLVRLDGFYVSRAETTVSEYRAFLSALSASGSSWGTTQQWLRDCNVHDGNAPAGVSVVGLTWDQAVAYCDWLSGVDGRRYRLPTEAEWEYLCRGGQLENHWWGNDWDRYRVSFRTGDRGSPFIGRPLPFGYFPQNAFGLYDVLGNAPEWTSDWYDGERGTAYRDSVIQNPQGPRTGAEKVVRGGSFQSTKELCSCVWRSVDLGGGAGFRVVCQVEDVTQVAAPREPEVASSARSSGQPLEDVALPERILKLIGGVIMKFVQVPEGEYQIGSPVSEAAAFRSPDEGPLSTVRITRPFWMGVTEVTQAQYCAVGSSVPGVALGDDLPIHGMLTRDMMSFIAELEAMLQRDGQLALGERLRRPTEIEWEYACRAGTQTAYCYGDSPGDLEDYAWFDSVAGPFPVGLKLPNQWGLYDMHGNVWELLISKGWEYTGGVIEVQPSGRPSGIHSPARRGGGWAFAAHRCRSASRQFAVAPYYVGMRLVISSDLTVIDPGLEH